MSDDQEIPDTLLIAGLGNPGSEYERTRHNAGKRVLEEFAYRSAGAGASWKEKFSGEFLTFQKSDSKIILLKPGTYMNESGRSLAAATSFFKLPPEQVCVLHDELDHPLGTIRFKRGGGDGGHNGLKSVSKALRSPNYIRLRIGIGRPNIGPNADNGDDLVHSWVLGRFSKSEDSSFDQVIDRSCEALDLLLAEGLKIAQTQINQRKPS